MEKRKPLYIGGYVQWYSHYEKWYEVSLGN